jgi:RNA polymerase sigma-70 factor (ECF subfamily)
VEEPVLIARAQRGDAVALAQLLQANYLAVKKYLVTVTFDRALAEDLTQETMVRAIQRIGQFNGRSRFSTWLIAIATRLYLDTLRQQEREQRRREALAQQAPPPGPDGAWTEVLERLRQLPRDVAIPIILKHYYGYTHEEIAQWMGIPVGTVKSRIFNGIRTLRRGLERDETGGKGDGDLGG